MLVYEIFLLAHHTGMILFWTHEIRCQVSLDFVAKNAALGGGYTMGFYQLKIAIATKLKTR